MPAVAIGIGTCLETKIDQYGASNSIENQTFLGEVSIISLSGHLNSLYLVHMNE